MSSTVPVYPAYRNFYPLGGVQNHAEPVARQLVQGVNETLAHYNAGLTVEWSAARRGRDGIILTIRIWTVGNADFASWDRGGPLVEHASPIAIISGQSAIRVVEQALAEADRRLAFMLHEVDTEVLRYAARRVADTW